MKLKLAYEGRCLTIGYISVSNNTIVGWYQPQFLNIHFINENVEKRDFHITYPRDGNAHYSYKYFDPADQCKYEKRVYYDEVVLKKFDLTGTFLGFEKMQRKEEDNDQHMVMRYKTPPLDDANLLFEFPQFGLRIGNRVREKIVDVCGNQQEDDIILNIDGYDGGTVNVGFFIYNSSREDYVYNVPGTLLLRKRFLALGSVYIEGYILVV